MNIKAWAIAAGMVLTCAISGAVAQGNEPKFPVESVQMAAGTGMPGQKPVDIRGLHAGMSSDAAAAVLREHYKSMAPNRLNVRMKTLRYASAPFAAYATNATFGESPYFDYVGAAFTSNANGNQVVAIASETRYQPGKEANTAETLAAIRKKYGEPSLQQDSFAGLNLVYAYKGGQIVPEKNVCLFQKARVSLADPDIIMLDHWYLRLMNVVEADNPKSLGLEVTGCSAVMYIDISYGSSAGQTNKNAIARMNISFFDAARFRAAAERDQIVQKELNDKARGAAPAGSGASKL